MLEPEDVSAMIRLKELGWGHQTVAREVGFSRSVGERETVFGESANRLSWVRHVRLMRARCLGSNPLPNNIINVRSPQSE